MNGVNIQHITLTLPTACGGGALPSPNGRGSLKSLSHWEREGAPKARKGEGGPTPLPGGAA